MHLECMLKYLFINWGKSLDCIRCPHCREQTMGIQQEVPSQDDNNGSDNELEEGEIVSDDNDDLESSNDLWGVSWNEMDNTLQIIQEPNVHQVQVIDSDSNAADNTEILDNSADNTEILDNSVDGELPVVNGLIVEAHSQNDENQSMLAVGFPSNFPDLEDGVHNIIGVEWL